MQYDFDRKIDRTGTFSYKWDGIPIEYPDNPKALPFWVADMDFPCPQPIVEAMKARAAHPIYGYSETNQRSKELTASWLCRHHKWDVKPEWVTFSGGVVPALAAMIRAFTEPGDHVIIQPPVYYPFQSTIQNNQRVVEENPLCFDGEKWVMNYEELECLAEKEETKMLILCNPHNPVSRVFTREELERLGEICLRYDVLIASDEIHGDIVYPGNNHVPIASLCKEMQDRVLTATSFSKTFNTAGLQMSEVIISNTERRQKFEQEMEKNSYLTNLFGVVALTAAYGNPECENYLEQLLTYLWNNYLYLDRFLKQYMPKIHCQRPEGTYLLWLDCRELSLSPKELSEFFLKEGGIALDWGEIFGDVGKGYVRINAACPREMLRQGLEQVCRAYQERNF